MGGLDAAPQLLNRNGVAVPIVCVLVDVIAEVHDQIDGCLRHITVGIKEALRVVRAGADADRKLLTRSAW